MARPLIHACVIICAIIPGLYSRKKARLIPKKTSRDKQ
ncbi:MAG: hypothetical protein KatS3mg129_0180 [Leptospiraceae bacterium]|nr:MAG: hypothetical protein KatS3mg129_0180 [Leptospiraceae bacterium]